MVEQAAQSKVLVLIPTYNDLDLLEDLSRQVLDLGPAYQPLIINDGSRVWLDDDVLDPRVLVGHCPGNFGLGLVTQLAMDHMVNYRYDYLVRIDADGQHPVHEIPNLIAHFNEPSIDIVAGVRSNHNEKDKTTLSRGFAKRYLKGLTKLFIRHPVVSDLNTGFYVLNKKAVLSLRGYNMEQYPEPEMFVRAGKLGLNVAEEPIEQLDRSYGKSTITAWRGFMMLFGFHLMLLDVVLGDRDA